MPQDSHHLGGDELQQNKLSVVEDGKRFHRFYPSSYPCFDSYLKDVASIVMISLVLDPYLVAVRKSSLPSNKDLSAKSCCLLLRALRGRSNRMTRTRYSKVAFCVNIMVTCGKEALQSTQSSPPAVLLQYSYDIDAI